MDIAGILSRRRFMPVDYVHGLARALGNDR
jgi:hypothetical protein